MSASNAISLDDPLWKKIGHAFGKAGDVPALLKKLDSRSDELAEVWEELTERLWHQGTVYQASYAALAHLVESAKHLQGESLFLALQLCAGIVADSAGGKKPKVAGQLEGAFLEAVADGRRLLGQITERFQNGEEEMVILLAAIAAFNGQYSLTEMLLNSDMLTCPKCGELIEECPHCETEFENVRDLFG